VTVRRHILIAEDDADIRASLRFLLEEEGYTVGEAEDGEATLAYLRATPEPCVIFLDLLMPRLSGMDVLRAVEAEPALSARHRFVLLTARYASLPPAEEELFAQNAVARVHKPFAIDDILEALRIATN
jgi:CheY-like chemotaxis protein